MRARLLWVAVALCPLAVACATGETIDDSGSGPAATLVDAGHDTTTDAGHDARADASADADAADVGDGASDADAAEVGDGASDADAAEVGDGSSDADAAEAGDAASDGDAAEAGDSASDVDAAEAGDAASDADAADAADVGDGASDADASGHDGAVACALPAAACANGAQTGYSCGTISSGATVIGRSAAKQPGGAATASSSDLCSFASNNIDVTTCDDSGYDHIYRVFLRGGEKVSISTTESLCPSSTGTLRLSVFQTTSDCSNPTSSSCLTSAPAIACAIGPQTYVAPTDGWVAIVVDSSVSGDGVVYALTVALDATTCAVAGCECP